MAKEMIFTGKLIPAEEAAAIGMVNRVCAADTLMEDVLKTAGVIAAKGKVSLRAAKQAISSGLNTDLATGLKIEVDAFAFAWPAQMPERAPVLFWKKERRNSMAV